MAKSSQVSDNELEEVKKRGNPDLVKKLCNIIKRHAGDKDGVDTVYERKDPSKPCTISNTHKTSDNSNIKPKPHDDNDSLQKTYSYYTRCSLQKIFSLMMDAPHVFADNGINANYMLDQNSTFLDIGSGFGYPGFIASFLSKCDSIGL